jgi:hypothetical protein
MVQIMAQKKRRKPRDRIISLFEVELKLKGSLSILDFIIQSNTKDKVILGFGL